MYYLSRDVLYENIVKLIKENTYFPEEGIYKLPTKK